MIVLSEEAFQRIIDLHNNPPAPTNCQLYWKDCREIGHPYYLSPPTHKMWKKISNWVDKAWRALIDPNLLDELFYTVLKDYFPDEEFSGQIYDENFDFAYFKHHPEKIDHTPTEELYPKLVQEIKKIIHDAKYDGVRVPVIEDAYFSEAFDRFYF